MSLYVTSYKVKDIIRQQKKPRGHKNNGFRSEVQTLELA